MSKRQIFYKNSNLDQNLDIKRQKTKNTKNATSELYCDFHLMFLLNIRDQDCPFRECNRNHNLSYEMYKIHQNTTNDVHNAYGQINVLITQIMEAHEEIRELRSEISNLKRRFDFWVKPESDIIPYPMTNNSQI